MFGLDGRMVWQIASVSYAERTEEGVLHGYQRPSVKRHIQEILEYLSSGSALLPNAIVVALDQRVTFEPLKNIQTSDWGTFGRLAIPLPRTSADKKAAWIVDGQQRATALAKLDPTRHFPIPIIGFQSSSATVQREQFLRVNKTKPLPRDLLIEILPEIESELPRELGKRRVASKVLQLTRFDRESPFFRRIRGLGANSEGANISQAAVLSVIQNSIRKKGVLYDHYDVATGKYDYKAMARVLRVYFEGVRRTWPAAWDGHPTTSRLVHGVGIVALGHLMDRVMLEVDSASPKAAFVVANRLNCIAKRCAWTSGRWPVLHCQWNELQNTSQDKSRLTDYLLKTYVGG